MDSLSDIFFPAFCAGCGKEGKYVCEECRIFLSENSSICPACRKANASGERHSWCADELGLDGLTSIWDYDGVIKNLLHRAKREGASHPLEEASKMALGVIARDQARFKAFLSFASLGNACIAYVPMHKKKEKTIGINHSEVMALEIGESMNLKTAGLLEKTRETKPQAGTGIKERQENVKGSFSPISGEYFPENVLLVDDIWETGATMGECCSILKKKGVKKVWGFVLARHV